MVEVVKVMVGVVTCRRKVEVVKVMEEEESYKHMEEVVKEMVEVETCKYRMEEAKMMDVVMTYNNMEEVATCNNMVEVSGRYKEVVVMERVEVEICSNMEVSCNSKVDRLLGDMVLVWGVDSSWMVGHSKAYHQRQH